MTERKPKTDKSSGPEDRLPAIAVLSGGAPNSPLAAGALCAIYQAGKTFDAFYCSGAGAAVGLLFVAPKDMTTPEALESVLGLSIADEIYNRFPIGYKTFYKSGPFTEAFQNWGDTFKIKGGSLNPSERLYNDWISLFTSAVTPTNLNFFSEGVCAPFPLIREVVDFDKIRHFKGDFFINAYCIDGGYQELFERDEIDARHFDAALAFPFVYPPYEIDDHFYFEGSTVDPVNLPRLARAYQDREDLRKKRIVLVDILGALQKTLVRRPRNIVDAWGISILAPITALAQLSVEKFVLTHSTEDWRLQPLEFDIPPEDRPFVADWSRSNMYRLWDLGIEAGTKFIHNHADTLPDREPEGPSPA